MAREPYTIIYAEAIVGHLRAIELKYRSLIRTTIEEHLRYEPDREKRNRKTLKQPTSLGADWEIRFGPDNRFRVFYTIHPEDRHVEILAIGEKEKNRLFIGGEEETL